MKKCMIFPALVSGLFLFSCSNESKEEKGMVGNKGEKTSAENAAGVGQLNIKDVSYALGYNVGEVLVKTDETLSIEDIVSGLRDSFSKSSSPRIREDEVKNILMLYNLQLGQSMRDKQEKKAQENMEKGRQFLATYSEHPDAVRDDSGLYYKVLEKGSGPIPQEDDTVLVEYTGKKIDGEIFFTTASTGQPAQFMVGDVIKGWIIALQKMPVGSTWEIVIPPELAYGERGVGDVIGPGETLIFQISLKDIVEDGREAGQSIGE